MTRTPPSDIRVIPRLRRHFVYWYMGRVAGRFCPCEWPIKSKRLIHLCGRIDDAQARYEFLRFAAFHMQVYRNQTSSTSQTPEIEWTVGPTYRRYPEPPSRRGVWLLICLLAAVLVLNLVEKGIG